MRVKSPQTIQQELSLDPETERKNFLALGIDPSKPEPEKTPGQDGKPDVPAGGCEDGQRRYSRREGVDCSAVRESLSGITASLMEAVK